MKTTITMEREDGKITVMEVDAGILKTIHGALETGADEFGMTDCDEAERTESAAWDFINEVHGFVNEPRFESQSLTN